MENIEIEAKNYAVNRRNENYDAESDIFELENERKITNEEKIMFQQWIDMNGGKEGSLYMTFPDEELEQIFLTSINICKKNKKIF